MFPALICSSSGGTVYTAVSTFCVYYVGWLLAGLEWNHSNPVIMTSYTNPREEQRVTSQKNPNIEEDTVLLTKDFRGEEIHYVT
jgi:hypothetical protein